MCAPRRHELAKYVTGTHMNRKEIEELLASMRRVALLARARRASARDLQINALTIKELRGRTQLSQPPCRGIQTRDIDVDAERNQRRSVGIADKGCAGLQAAPIREFG